MKEFKPCLSGYIAESLHLLRSETFPDEDSVHDVRVLMKKSRAVMKLIRDQVERSFFEKEYDTFREAGRILAEWRETAVHRRTLKTIRKSNKKLFERLKGNPKLDAILAKPDKQSAFDQVNAERTEKIIEILNKSYYRVRFYNFGKPDFKILYQSLNKTYLDLSKLYLECRNNPKPLKLHRLRKKVKDLLYQVYFFRPLNPLKVKKLEERLIALAQYLGKYNDITQIILSFGYKVGEAENTSEFDELVAVLRGVQDEYLMEIWPLSFQLFRPGQKLENLLGYKMLIIQD